MRVLICLCLALAVRCAPNLQLGGLKVPFGPAPGQSGSSYDVHLTGAGLELQRHKEHHTQRSDHRVERENATCRDDQDPDHIRESESEATRTHDSQESLEQTEDSGVKLGWSGVQLYNDTSNVEDRSRVDTESGSTREQSVDKSSDATHISTSGSEYSRRNTSRDHHEDRQHTAIDLNGDFTKHMKTFANANVGDMFNNIGKKGSGEVLSKTGRGKGGNATRESMTLDTHEGTKEDSGRNWTRTEDQVKDGNQTSVKTTNQVSNHTAASKESSKNETHEKETKIIEGDDDKVEHTSDGLDTSNGQGNAGSPVGEEQGKSNETDNIGHPSYDEQEKRSQQGNGGPAGVDQRQ